jgi:hypothetical protein
MRQLQRNGVLRMSDHLSRIQARLANLEAEAAHDQDPNESAPAALRRVREERDDLRAQVQEHVEGARRDERRIGELETAISSVRTLVVSWQRMADELKPQPGQFEQTMGGALEGAAEQLEAVLADATSPKGAPVRAEVEDVRKGPPRAVVDLTSWPALREVEAQRAWCCTRCGKHPVAPPLLLCMWCAGLDKPSPSTAGGAVFLGDDPEGVAEAFDASRGVKAAVLPAVEPLCLCPATSEYDPPCPRHGVLGIGVTGRG